MNATLIASSASLTAYRGLRGDLLSKTDDNQAKFDRILRSVLDNRHADHAKLANQVALEVKYARRILALVESFKGKLFTPLVLLCVLFLVVYQVKEESAHFVSQPPKSAIVRTPVL